MPIAFYSRRKTALYGPSRILAGCPQARARAIVNHCAIALLGPSPYLPECL